MLMRVEAVLKARSNLLGPTSAKEVILGYKRVQGGFEGASVGKEAAKEESNVLNKRRKIPPASPAPSSMRRFARLSRGRYYTPLSPAETTLSAAACRHRPRIDRQRSPRFAGL
jgi:hypothetical protein